MREHWEWSMKTELLCLTLSWKKIPHFPSMDRNIQQHLHSGMHKVEVTKGLAPTAISSLFLQCSNNRHTRSQSDFSIPKVNAVYFGQNSIRYLARTFNRTQSQCNCFKKCWIFFVEFKSLIKNWKPSNCMPLHVMQSKD